MRGAFDPNSFDNASLPSMFNPQKKLAFQHGPFWAFIGPFCFVSHLLRDSLPKLQGSTGISGHASKLTKKVFLETSGPKVPGFLAPLSANNFCPFWATLLLWYRRSLYISLTWCDSGRSGSKKVDWDGARSFSIDSQWNQIGNHLF